MPVARKALPLACAAALLGAALTPTVARFVEARRARGRVDALTSTPTSELSARLADASLDPARRARLDHLGPLLASWETVGGCGAGAATGAGGGIKWIGHNVSGGLLHVELQSAYVHTDYGYNLVETALLTHDLDPDWNVGLTAPYLYKYMPDLRAGYPHIANAGPGDVGALVTRRFGAIHDWTSTLVVNAPTGAHTAAYPGTMAYLPQDRQLGLGPHATTVVTASLTVDHTIDHDWGLTVLGGIASWRGGKNELDSYRAPSASVYGYSGYILGPLVPALGVTVSGVAGHDRDQGNEQPTPVVLVAANASIEWSTDWLAVILGGSVPYGWSNAVQGTPVGWSFAPWTVALGVAFAPF